MQGNVWRWVAWACVALFVVKTAIRAFAAPWSWTLDQDFVVFCAAAILLIIAIWLRVWLKEGNAGVRERLQFGRQTRAAMRANPKRTVINFAIWIVIAGVLVVVFNMQQH